MIEERSFNVLYVDDDVNNLVSLKSSFKNYYNIYTSDSAEEAFIILEENPIQVILVDQCMPKIGGSEFLEAVKKQAPDPVCILITGYSDIKALIEVINKGHAYRYLMKPFHDFELKVTLDNAFELYYLRKENKELKLLNSSK